MKLKMGVILSILALVIILGIFFQKKSFKEEKEESLSSSAVSSQEELKREESNTSLEKANQEKALSSAKSSLGEENSLESKELQNEKKYFLYNHDSFLPLIISFPWLNYSLEEFEIWLASLKIDFSKISQDLTVDEISVNYEVSNIQSKEIQMIKWNFRTPFPGEKILWNSLKIVYTPSQMSFEKIWNDYLLQSGSSQKQLNIEEKNGIIHLINQRKIFISEDPDTHEIIVVLERNENEE